MVVVCVGVCMFRVTCSDDGLTNCGKNIGGNGQNST